jgi:hypothetical protein
MIKLKSGKIEETREILSDDVKAYRSSLKDADLHGETHLIVAIDLTYDNEERSRNIISCLRNAFNAVVDSGSHNQPDPAPESHDSESDI